MREVYTNKCLNVENWKCKTRWSMLQVLVAKQSKKHYKFCFNLWGDSNMENVWRRGQCLVSNDGHERGVKKKPNWRIVEKKLFWEGAMIESTFAKLDVDALAFQIKMWMLTVSFSFCFLNSAICVVFFSYVAFFFASF